MIIALVPKPTRKIRIRVISDDEMTMTFPKNAKPTLDNLKTVVWFYRSPLQSEELSIELVLTTFWRDLFLCPRDLDLLHNYLNSLES